jgi:hypothetical protein
MRITRPLTYESMLQSAGKGCIICALLKSYQSTLLENLQPAELKQLCEHCSRGDCEERRGSVSAAARTRG